MGESDSSSGRDEQSEGAEAVSDDEHADTAPRQTRVGAEAERRWEDTRMVGLPWTPPSSPSKKGAALHDDGRWPSHAIGETKAARAGPTPPPSTPTELLAPHELGWPTASTGEADTMDAVVGLGGWGQPGSQGARTQRQAYTGRSASAFSWHRRRIVGLLQIDESTDDDDADDLPSAASATASAACSRRVPASFF